MKSVVRSIREVAGDMWGERSMNGIKPGNVEDQKWRNWGNWGPTGRHEMQLPEVARWRVWVHGRLYHDDDVGFPGSPS